MATKLWRGDAPAVAQVTTVTPANIEVGDIFTLTMNGKSISFAATDTLASTVCAGLAAAIGATDIPEFSEVTTSVSGGVLTLTAAEAGVPFTVTGGTTNDGGGSVDVTTTTQGSAAASEVQEFDINETAAAAASFFIAFGGVETSALTVGDSAAAVEAAIEALSTVGSGNVSVSKATNTLDGQTTATYTVTFTSALASTAVPLLAVRLEYGDPLIICKVEGGPAKNEVQTIRLPTSDMTGETYTLTILGETTGSLGADSTTAASLQAALNLLLDYSTTGRYVDVTDGDEENSFDVTFRGVLEGWDIATMTAAGSWLAADGEYPITVTETTAGGAATNEVQVITLNGPPTGGTFTLSHDGNTTSAIAYNAAASAVQSALQALASIGIGGATVTGSGGGPWTVTFGGSNAATNMSEISGSGSGLTGQDAQTLTVTTTVSSSGPHHWDDPLNWLPSGVPVDSDDVRFELGSSDCLYGLSQSAVTLTSLHVGMTYSGQIGLPRQNENDYIEYRTQELTIGCTNLLIGYGEGSGPGKVAVNTGAVQTTIEIRGSGGSTDPGIPAVIWRGSHASNDITVLDGDFGTAPYSDQSAVIDQLIQRGGTVALKHTALNDLLATGQNISAHDCTLGSQPLEL